MSEEEKYSTEEIQNMLYNTLRAFNMELNELYTVNDVIEEDGEYESTLVVNRLPVVGRYIRALFRRRVPLATIRELVKTALAINPDNPARKQIRLHIYLRTRQNLIRVLDQFDFGEDIEILNQIIENLMGEQQADSIISVNVPDDVEFFHSSTYERFIDYTNEEIQRFIDYGRLILDLIPVSEYNERELVQYLLQKDLKYDRLLHKAIFDYVRSHPEALARTEAYVNMSTYVANKDSGIPGCTKTSCSICFFDFFDPEIYPSQQYDKICQLPCLHCFHLECIKNWKNNTCPVCRAPYRIEDRVINSLSKVVFVGQGLGDIE